MMILYRHRSASFIVKLKNIQPLCRRSLENHTAIIRLVNGEIILFYQDLPLLPISTSNECSQKIPGFPLTASRYWSKQE